MKSFANKYAVVDYLRKDVLGQFIQSTTISDGDHGVSLEKHIHGHTVGNDSAGDIVYKNGEFSELKAYLNKDSIHIAKTTLSTTPSKEKHLDWCYSKMKSTFIVDMIRDKISKASCLYPEDKFLAKGYRVKEIIWLEGLDYNKFVNLLRTRLSSNNTKFESSISFNYLIKCYKFGKYLSSYNQKKYA